MSDKFFLDTNLFVYSFDATAPRKSARASRLIRDGIESGTGVVSFQVVQEFFSVAFRRFLEPMSTFAAEEYFNTVFRPLLSIHSSPALVLSALQVYGQYHFSWYDSLIVAAAQEGGCSILYSEDMQHGHRVGDLRIHDPFR